MGSLGCLLVPGQVESGEVKVDRRADQVSQDQGEVPVLEQPSRRRQSSGSARSRSTGVC